MAESGWAEIFQWNRYAMISDDSVLLYNTLPITDLTLHSMVSDVYVM